MPSMLGVGLLMVLLACIEIRENGKLNTVQRLVIIVVILMTLGEVYLVH